MSRSSSSSYINTPYGIMSAGGRWYHVTEEELRDYAGEVLDYVSLDQLLEWAEVWVTSAGTVVLWALPVLLWALPLPWAVASALGLYLLWANGSPALPSIVAVRVVTVLDHALAQSLYYVLVLSVLAAADMHAAVGVGLAGFVLLRWGVVGWLFGYIVRPLRRSLYPLPVADQILRGLIIRVALKHRLSLPQLNEITENILENLRSREKPENDE